MIFDALDSMKFTYMCPNVVMYFSGSCSHGRSEYLFMESIEDSEAFLSKKCDSYDNYLSGACDDNETVAMGGDLTPENAGTYYLETNSEYPYSQN